MKVGFGSDNHAGVHPEILASLAQVNEGHAPAYETDEISQRAHECLKRHFGSQAESFFVFNGTAANVLALRALAESYHSVLCAEVSHINNDECGAPEKIAGVKIISLAHQNGKLAPETIRRHLIRRGDQHTSQPRVVSVTQATELGTIYSGEELRAIGELCRRENLMFHVDGARLVNAAAAMNVSLKELTTDVGVDVVSFGGTKNGLLVGEAIVFLKPGLSDGFRFHRKQNMQLPSKTRFIAAQFEAWLSNDLWLRIARHANEMAQHLRRELEAFSFIEITQPTQINAVFARIPQKLVAPLREKYFFYVMDEHTFEARLMTAFDTRLEDIKGFAAHLKEVSARFGY